MGLSEQETARDRLARATAALAQAEGVAGVRAGGVPGAEQQEPSSRVGEPMPSRVSTLSLIHI